MFAQHQQRDLRAPMPQRPSLRWAASAEHQAQVAAHLTPRDRWLARVLAEHRVLTSTQIAAIAFAGSRRAANHRLQKLYAWRVLDRFQPYVGRGRAPMHYVLDTTGAHLLAHEDGLDPKDLKFRADRSVGIAYSLRLVHLMGVNSFFTTLLADALTNPATDRTVTAWWSEARCTRHFGDHVRPDGYGRWHEDGREIEWFLEWDTGSYQLSRFVSKLPGYASLAAATRIVTPLLAVFATETRETHARRQLAEHLRTTPRQHDLPIATTTAEHLRTTGSPASGVWLPLHRTNAGRHRLISLLSAWPHLETPTSSADTSGADPSPVARLRPPVPMPPWQARDLTWSPRR
ncbi:Replication-relaxation [Saccharopolyspora antimicrobica]|uniref:Replication-relaxation n=1 Tax=Saccharopolyspora antimicrobica TaxID=455193 RepID=A0A1I5B034_9PSEU|nr:replication-relaxation family protein [Saccharopolyspora antimicrobica]RKT86425.1 protein involved in plasmid replication-relaxation [Saccharopolyspora antimicrobica]SFN68063.1 Replication-relaxation [Saccharopolyspora antimicrobica]